MILANLLVTFHVVHRSTAIRRANRYLHFIPNRCDLEVAMLTQLTCALLHEALLQVLHHALP